MPDSNHLSSINYWFPLVFTSSSVVYINPILFKFIHLFQVAFTGATLYLMCVSTLLAAAHSFCSESATPTGPPSPLSSSSSMASLPGFPLDSSPSPMWSSNSTVQLAASTNTKGHVFGSPRSLQPIPQLPEVPMLTRSRWKTDPGPKPVNHSISSPSFANIVWIFSKLKYGWDNTFHKADGGLNSEPGVSRKLESCGMSTESGDHQLESRVHPSIHETRSPVNIEHGSSRQLGFSLPLGYSRPLGYSHPLGYNLPLGYSHPLGYGRPLIPSPDHTIDGARVEVPQAIELGYNHKGTFHWNLLANNSSLSEESRFGTFGVLFQYLLSS